MIYFGVKAKKKFIVQIFVSSLLPISWLFINNLYGFMGIHSISFWVGAPLTVFILVFIMNATNLIDGIDGLSASLSFIALGGVLLLFSRRRNVDLLHIDSWLNGCLGTFSLL